MKDREKALRHRFVYGKPHLFREVFQFDDGPSAAWVCDGGTLVAGVGPTPQDAYIDHVEEHWALTGPIMRAKFNEEDT